VNDDDYDYDDDDDDDDAAAAAAAAAADDDDDEDDDDYDERLRGQEIHSSQMWLHEQADAPLADDLVLNIVGFACA
jgi:hypothetical protein